MTFCCCLFHDKLLLLDLCYQPQDWFFRGHRRDWQRCAHFSSLYFLSLNQLSVCDRLPPLFLGNAILQLFSVDHFFKVFQSCRVDILASPCRGSYWLAWRAHTCQTFGVSIAICLDLTSVLALRERQTWFLGSLVFFLELHIFPELLLMVPLFTVTQSLAEVTGQSKGADMLYGPSRTYLGAHMPSW